MHRQTIVLNTFHDVGDISVLDYNCGVIRLKPVGWANVLFDPRYG